MMISRFRTSLVSAIALGVAFAPCAHAQEVDYGALEQMFGEPVTTSATGSPQTASQAPANMQIISSDDIRRSGATNIPDILRFLAGMDVRSYGALNSEVSIRGFSVEFNPRLLVLINGREVYVDDYGFVVWQAIPVNLNNIRQIEIVRGPASALFGFNAVSGVVNIITYDPLHDKTNVASVGVGTAGLLTGSVVATAQNPGKIGVTASATGLKTNEFSTHDLAHPHNPYDKKEWNGSISIDARYKPVSNIEVTAEVTDAQSKSLDQVFLYQPDNAQFRSDSVKLGVLADTPYGLLSAQGYINETLNHNSLTSVSQPPVDLFNQIGDLQVNDLIKIADVHAIRFAFEYRNSRDWAPSFLGDARYEDYAGSIMWNWQITPELALTNAVRVDHMVIERTDPLTPVNPYTLADFKHSGTTQPSFNSGLVYQPTSNDTFRLLVGRAVQAPSLIDYAIQNIGHAGPFTAYSVGNPFIKPAITTNYEFDYDRVVAPLESTLKTAIYYNDTRDILASATNTPFSFVPPNLLTTYSQNIGHDQALGGEIGLYGSDPRGWRWNLAYSLTVVRSHLTYAPPVIPFAFNNSTPTSAIDFGLGYTWNKLEADMQGKWQSNYTDYVQPNIGQGYYPRQITNYVTLSARVGYQLTPTLTVAVAGQQLQSPQSIETVGPQVQRQILFSATYDF